MDNMKARYVASGLCILLFIAARTFQQFAYWLWIPVSHGPQDDLLAYLLPIDRVRAILIMSTIVVLIVPFVVIAIRYFEVAPLASLLGGSLEQRSSASNFPTAVWISS